MTMVLRDQAWIDSDLRRSMKHRLLRWQATLEGSGPDRAIPWVFAVILFVLFASLSLARYRSLELGGDFASWLQGIWLLGEGRDPTVSLTGRSVFEGQFSIIMWPISQVARVVPAGPLLLILQSAALALGVVPLWRVSRGVLELGVEAALAVSIAYAFQPELHNLNLSEFHPEALAVPAMLYAYVMSQRGHWWRYTLAVILALATRSDLGLVVIGLGALVAVEGRTRAGRITAAGGAAWALIALLVFQADLAGGEFIHAEAFAEYGDGPVAILWGMLTDPLQVLQDFFAEENFATLILLFAPWLFLPLLQLRFQMPLVLFGVFGFIAAIPPGEFGAPQQNVAALAFLPLAAAFALRHVGRRSVRRVFVNGKLLLGLLVATFAFFLVAAGSSLYNEPWTWGSRSELDSNIIAAVDGVGADESVSAFAEVLPLVAEREVLVEFPMDAQVHRAWDPSFSADVIIIDEADDRWMEANKRITFDLIIDAAGYVATERFGTVSVYRPDTAAS